MRSTRGKPTAQTVLLGDRDLAGRLAEALAAMDDVERYTHGFHTYPAGLHPDCARLLLETLEGQVVLDPFCGGGTVLVEARVAGRTVHGRDISPVALRVARARSATVSDEVLTSFRSMSRKLTAIARAATDPPDERIREVVSGWYNNAAQMELQSLRTGIAEAPDEIRYLLEACFSSILVKVSWRKSDTSAKREKHRRPAGTTAILFHKKCRELARRIVDLREAVPPDTPKADIRPGDARRIDAPPTHLILTSPPYPSTYDYLPMQHLRQVWMGDDDHAKREIGPRRAWRHGAKNARKQWADDTFAWTTSAAACLESGGQLAVVIGDGRTPAGTIDTSQPTEDAARAAGLKSVARASLERPDHARGDTRWEHVFVFRKE